MTVPLVLLAIPATRLGLLVGLPPERRLDPQFLEPVFFKVESEPFAWAGTSVRALMLVSLPLVFARHRHRLDVIYVRRTELPGRFAGAFLGRLPGVVQQVLHGRVLRGRRRVRAIALARAGCGRFVDAKVIDGAVNGLARLWQLAGERLRPLQTGRVQNYAVRHLRRHARARRGRLAWV